MSDNFWRAKMDATVYDAWSQYYDPEGIEKKQIDKQLRAHFGENGTDVWKNKRVLEIGCGTGRFSTKIINDVEVLYAIEPDISRLEILRKKLQNIPDNRKRFFNSTLNKLRKESCLWDKFDIIIFSWSWAYIDENNENNEKAKTLDIAMNLLKEHGAIVFTMVIGGEFEETCDRVNQKYLRIRTSDLERNKLAMEKLLRLANYKKPFDSVVYNGVINTYFKFPSNQIAIEEIKNDIGVNVSCAMIQDEIGEKDQLSDKLQLVILKKAPHKKITFNYKLCDNQGDCSAMVACQNYSVGAIVRKSDDINQSMQLRVLEHLCVECKRCISICELFSLHNTWAEFFEKNRQIEALERKVEYMDEFRYGSGSGDSTRRLRNLEQLIRILDIRDTPWILQIVDGNNHASSYDCPKIKELIGAKRFDQIYYKFDIPSSTNKEEFLTIRQKLKDLLNIKIFPSLAVIYNHNVLYMYEGHLSITNDGNSRISQVQEEINAVLKEMENV